MNNIESRIYGLVEELRADIDFELEDVITEIVRELPENYFQRVGHKDQLVHLKALLALSFCKLQEELVFRSSDGVHSAVIARQNYSGQLARILNRLPADRRLTGAKIFTSCNHDFIIDLFEFEPTDAEHTPTVFRSEASGEATIKEVAQATQAAPEVIAEFISHYAPTSQIFDCPAEIAEHFFAAQEVKQNDIPIIRWQKEPGNDRIKLTIASGKIKARRLVELVAEYLGGQNLDIESAFLNDLKFSDESRTAIASFELVGDGQAFSKHETAILESLISFTVTQDPPINF